jgi:hypothetical protein
MISLGLTQNPPVDKAELKSLVWIVGINFLALI